MFLFGEFVLNRTPRKPEFKEQWEMFMQALSKSGLSFQRPEFIEGVMLAEVCAPIALNRELFWEKGIALTFDYMSDDKDVLIDKLFWHYACASDEAMELLDNSKYGVLSNICRAEQPTSEQLREWAHGFLAGVELWIPGFARQEIRHGTASMLAISYLAKPDAFPSTSNPRLVWPDLFTDPRAALTEIVFELHAFRNEVIEFQELEAEDNALEQAGRN